MTIERQVSTLLATTNTQQLAVHANELWGDPGSPWTVWLVSDDVNSQQVLTPLTANEARRLATMLTDAADRTELVNAADRRDRVAAVPACRTA